MRIFTPLFLIIFMAFGQANAEGTREVAPNGSIDIMGNATTDVAALHINNPSYNSFAAYDNPDPLSRLYIHIQDPTKECIYLGFNWAHDNITSPNPTRINFEYRIKDPNGNIVYGPISVTPATANIVDWASGHTGPLQIYGSGGYNAINVSSADLSAQGWSGKGDYYIEFRDEANNDLLIDFWDISVADCTQPVPVEEKGRVWSYNWSIFAINDFGFPNRPFNGAFYVCAPDPDNLDASFITKIDFNDAGFQPAAFNVAFNSFGIQNTGNVGQDRKSVENTNGTIAEYAIFLNDPVDICETAEPGELQILGVGRCDGEDYCIKFMATKAGQIDLLLDFDGPDNMYTPGTADVMISKTITAAQVGVPTCIEWDGLDGLGNTLLEDVATQIPIVIAFAQGIYHFPIYDAEYMINGFMIEAVRPAATVSLVFYDDSNISVVSGSGEPSAQLSGCMPPCHRWINYTMPTTPGFGNLNTINSWWFSQLIVRQDVFFLPNYYTCEIEGPASFCTGGTAVLDFIPSVLPVGADGLEIITKTWTGPGIVGGNNGSTITIDDGGLYELELQWINSVGDTCATHCSYEVFLEPPGESEIDTLIVQGDAVVINGETYTEAGEFIQVLSTSEGCDSILTINIIVISTVIHYDLNECESFMGNGSHMDYSEFVPTYPDPLSCATIFADTLHRDNPQVNKHSCTPGIDGSAGMCVGILDSCDYVPGHEASVIIEVTVTPDPDTAVQITSFSFFEKAPMMFEWISGISGLNNYPTLFQVRILKNGTEIFLSGPSSTSMTWNENVYDFFGNNDFLVKDQTTFRFELLSYCPVGNAGMQAVWDLDEISIQASCASLEGLNRSIAGVVRTLSGLPVPGVELQLYDDQTFLQHRSTNSTTGGDYLFDNVVTDDDYFIYGYKNTDHLNGVNTLDLIHIQKHLLGITPFTSPYQIIAADANNSKSISALDLLDLRKLLLGIYTELPRNLSWRFGPANQNISLQNPWSFSESIAIEYFTDDISDANFVGVKIGDVTGDVDPKLGNQTILSRSEDVLILHAEDMELKSGELTKVDITIDQLTEIAGLQLTLGIEDGQILDLMPGALNIDQSHFYIVDGNLLLISWNDIGLVSLNPSEVLFSVLLSPDRDGSLAQSLFVNQTGLKPEAYLSDQLITTPIEIEILDVKEIAFQNQLLPNRPNPFSDQTTIRFELESAGTATLSFHNLSGQLIHQEKGDYNAGLNSIDVSRRVLGVSPGVIICRIQTNGFSAARKMVMMN